MVAASWGEPLTSQPMKRVYAAFERRVRERRLFIKSENHTRFVRLGVRAQLLAWTAGGMFVAWAILVTAILLIDSIGAGSYRDQAARDLNIYEDRLNALSDERDLRRKEAVAAQERFVAALEQISALQSELLTSTERHRELDTGLRALQATLRKTMSDRKEAEERLATLQASEEGDVVQASEASIGAIDLLANALAETAAERDQIATEAIDASVVTENFDLELRLMKERNNEILGQLEDALTVPAEPLDDMFRAADLEPEQLMRDVHQDHSQKSASLTQIQMSTMGAADLADETLRANRILDQLDRINHYRLAVERIPFAMPVQASFRYTSGFGPRWGRMHKGLDMAGPVGTPIYSTADGVVTYAGWQSGYGRIIKVQHEFGIETRYPHLNKIRVKVGQKVSRGEQIGDMGSSGRSTGPHLHYEIRVKGEAVDPMIYIRAAQNTL